MSFSIENTSTLGRRISVRIPEQDIEQKVAEKLKEYAKSAKIDGFRPGKVPVSVIKTRYGKAVRDEVVDEMLQNTLYEHMKEEKLTPAGPPIIEDIKMEKGQPLEYVATFEVHPTIELKDFSELNFEKETVNITDEDVADSIEDTRKQYMEWTEVDRVAKENDRVIIDFEGKCNGKPFADGTAKEVSVVLGAKAFLPDFEEGIIKAQLKAGDTYTIHIHFPKDYHDKELAGQPVTFDIKVHKVEEGTLPELNEDFFKKLGLEGKGIEDLREEVRAHMQFEADQVLATNNKIKVFDKLLAETSIELPQSLVDQEVESLHRYLHNDDKAKAESHSADEHPGLKEQARRRVTTSLLLAEIADRYKIKPDPERLGSVINQMIALNIRPEQIASQPLSAFSALILEGQVVDFIMEKAQVTEKAKTYTEIMNPKASEE